MLIDPNSHPILSSSELSECMHGFVHVWEFVGLFFFILLDKCDTPDASIVANTVECLIGTLQN